MDKDNLDLKSREKRLDETNVGLDGAKLQDVDVDGVLQYLGQYGRYQMIQMLLLCTCYVGMSLPIVHGIFVGKFVDFRCSNVGPSGYSLTPNQTLKLSECRVEVMDNETSRVLHKETCTKHDYEGGDTFTSYIAEWDLVCDKEVLGQLPQILLVVGQVFGAGLIPPIGDRYGRKKLVVVNVIGLFLGMLVSAFVQQFDLFLVLRFLTGACLQGVAVAIGTMMLEIVPIEMRHVISVAQSGFWIVALTWNGLFGYVLRDADWRMLQIAYALIGGIPSIISLFFLDESFRWLAGNSRAKEAVAILKKACRWNDKSYEIMVDRIASNTEKDDSSLQLTKPTKNGTDVATDPTHPNADCKIMDMVQNKNARKITLVMCYTWCCVSLTYYGIILMSTSLAGDPYLNYFLTCIVEIPGGLMSFVLLKYMDRKPMLIGFNLAAAASLLLVVLVANVAPSEYAFEILQTCLTLVGQLFVMQIFTCVWVNTPELYPTNLRNIGLGISSSAARIGASFSPLFTILARKIPWAPGALFGGGCLINACLLMMIPETRRVPLPVTLQDVDNMCKKKTKQYSSVINHDDRSGLQAEEKV